MTSLTYILIGLGVIITIIQSTVFFKILTRLERRITAVEDYVKETPPSKPTRVVNTEDQIATGLMRGMQMLRDDDERTLQLLDMARKLKRQPTYPMTSNDVGPESFDTGGDLIPPNLSREEQEILKMFYDKRI